MKVFDGGETGSRSKTNHLHEGNSKDPTPASLAAGQSAYRSACVRTSVIPERWEGGCRLKHADFRVERDVMGCSSKIQEGEEIRLTARGRIQELSNRLAGGRNHKERKVSSITRSSYTRRAL